MKKASAVHWDSSIQSHFVQSYGGVMDLANGFDSTSSFESHLKFQSLFFERILVPDGFFYMPGPAFEHVRKVNRKGDEWGKSALLELLRAGVIVPTLRAGDSLLENWIRGGKGIKPGELGYPSLNEGKSILEVIEPNVALYARWPEIMADSMKPAYALELEKLFIGNNGGDSIVGRKEIQYCLKLKNSPNSGWHALFDRFRHSIVTQMAGQEFRRAGLEQAVVDHFELPRFSDVYELLNRRSKIQDESRWAEYATAHFLLKISTTIYEAYQARQFNCVGNLFPGFFRPVVNAELYSRVVELNAGRPYSGGEIVPQLCINPRKISIEEIIKFRESPIFKDQYCAMLHNLRNEGASQPFVETNHKFYTFLKTKYLPAILKAFEPAVNRDRLKQMGDLVQVAGAATAIAGVVSTQLISTHCLGIALLTTVATFGGKGIEKAAETTERLATRSRNAWLLHGAERRLNGFIAMERDAAQGAGN